MSTKATRKFLLDYIEIHKGVPEDLERAGSLAEAEATRDRLLAAKTALAEVEAIERAAKSLRDGGGIDVLRREDYDVTCDLMESIARDAP